jgi:hypothetical protein
MDGVNNSDFLLKNYSKIKCGTWKINLNRYFEFPISLFNKTNYPYDFIN